MALAPRFMNYSRDFVENFFAGLTDASPIDKALRLRPGQARRQHDHGVGPGSACSVSRP
jgi:hypothetical protein